MQVQQHEVTALEVADEDFLVASLIERCPKTMMIRELMMNAIEAARLAPEDKRQIEISAESVDGTGLPQRRQWYSANCVRIVDPYSQEGSPDRCRLRGMK
jgi:hypothetical protein